MSTGNSGDANLLVQAALVALAALTTLLTLLHRC